MTTFTVAPSSGVPYADALFGLNVLHLTCDSHTSFKVKMSKGKVTRPINTDTNILRHVFRMRTYRIPLVVVVGIMFGYLSPIFVSVCTKLAHSILMRDRSIVTEPNFRRSH